MGSPSPFDLTDTHASGPGFPPEDRLYLPPLSAAARPREPLWRSLVLFGLTVLTTMWAGRVHYAGFYLDPTASELPWTFWELFLRGAWYSVPILAILGAHELGHYYACRYYGVDASRPYFLPMPLLLTGTLGAFIRIRQQVRSKRELFDIGIAGPIAGFIVAVPVLLVGASMSRMVELPSEGAVEFFGEPLLVQFAIWLNFGTRPDGYDVIFHPMAFAAWFGLLATALNLFPIGQLDGGHISYAVLGRKSTFVTLGSVASVIALTFLSMSWILWAALMVVMLLTFGPRHPRTFDEDVPLDPARKWLAAFALLMFVLCFTPVPLSIIDLGAN
jgi:membrane-associated protease RseP (regulator of RpoE activity)